MFQILTEFVMFWYLNSHIDNINWICMQCMLEQYSLVYNNLYNQYACEYVFAIIPAINKNFSAPPLCGKLYDKITCQFKCNITSLIYLLRY